MDSAATVARRIIGRRSALVWLLWWIVFAGATAMLLAFRSDVDKAHVVLVYLLVVLGASAAGGRLLGVLLAIAAFLTFDWAFLSPFGTLAVRNPLDWLALVTFLVTSIVAAQLLYTARAQRAAVERESATREASLLKDALLAAISHDLRTPLTSIKAFAHEITADGDDRALMIEEEADRLNRLVSDLLDVARLNGGNFAMDIQVNGVDDLLGAVVRQFEGLPDRHRLHAMLDQPDEIVMGRFDFVQTLRIVANLVENALKYSPLDAPVELHGGRDGADVRFRVSDRGAGIPDSEKALVFEPFARITAAPPDAGSAGLGLSIAMGLTRSQGGTLTHSARLGGGTVFSLRLPLA